MNDPVVETRATTLIVVIVAIVIGTIGITMIAAHQLGVSAIKFN